MNTKICNNCKYYKPIDWLQIAGNCLCPKFHQGYDIDVPIIDGIIVENDEGWGFRVGENFGCIHFIDKENEV
jgi:hypothetical protein